MNQLWSSLTTDLAQPGVLGILIVAALRCAAVLVVAAALVLAFGRHRPLVRRATWSAAFVAVIALPVLSATLPRWSVPLPAMRQSESAQHPPINETPSEVAATHHLHAVAPTQPGAWPWIDTFTPTMVIISLWAFIGVALVIRLLGGLTGVMRQAARGCSINPARDRDIAYALKELRVHRRVRFIVSETVGSPLTYGVLRPVVVLPCEYHGWSSRRRRVVLLHELVHVKRLDWLLQMLAQLVAAVHWFNPLAWYAAARLAVDRELACDEAVIATGVRPTDYANHLLEIARSAAGRRHPPSAALAMAHRSQMEGRIMSMLNSSSKSRQRWQLLASMVVVAGSGVALASAHPHHPEPTRHQSDARKTKDADRMHARLGQRSGIIEKLGHIERRMSQSGLSRGEIAQLKDQLAELIATFRGGDRGHAPDGSSSFVVRSGEWHSDAADAPHAQHKDGLIIQFDADRMFFSDDEALHHDGDAQAVFELFFDEAEPHQRDMEKLHRHLRQLQEKVAHEQHGIEGIQRQVIEKQHKIELHHRQLEEQSHHAEKLHFLMKKHADGEAGPALMELKEKLSAIQGKRLHMIEKMAPMQFELKELHEQIKPHLARIKRLHVEGMEPLHRKIGEKAMIIEKLHGMIAPMVHKFGEDEIIVELAVRLGDNAFFGVHESDDDNQIVIELKGRLGDNTFFGIHNGDDDAECTPRRAVQIKRHVRGGEGNVIIERLPHADFEWTELPGSDAGALCPECAKKAKVKSRSNVIIKRKAIDARNIRQGQYRQLIELKELAGRGKSSCEGCCSCPKGGSIDKR